MKAKWLAAVAVCAISVTAGISASAATKCVRSEEKTALEVRALQTDMMVAALSCNATREYNEFVTRFKSALNNHSTTLNAMFSRFYGRAADREFLRYTTSLANQASLASATDSGTFCTSTTTTLRQAVNVALKDFESIVVGRKAYASDLGPTGKIEVCKTATGTKSAAKSTASNSF
jgi:hypothetical protein